jgi:inhibitor-of-growth protein 1
LIKTYLLHNFIGYLKDVEVYKDILKQDNFESAAQRKILCKLEQVLISLQEVGDEKVEIGQQIIDLIDNKYRQLDQNLRNTGK